MLEVLIYLATGNFKSSPDRLEKNTAKIKTDLKNNIHKFKVVIFAP